MFRRSFSCARLGGEGFRSRGILIIGRAIRSFVEGHNEFYGASIGLGDTGKKFQDHLGCIPF